MIKTYSLKEKGGQFKLSEHFKLSEFACPDKSDKVVVSDELIRMLEKLRAYGGFTIEVTSGYRTVSYNSKIGGAKGSKHTLGQAADIYVRKNGKLINVKLISCLCQDLGFNGIGSMNNAVHVDVASRIYRGDEKHGYGNNVGGDFYKYFGIKKSQVEALRDVSVKEQQSDGYMIEVTANRLNLRKGPSTDSEVCDVLKKGSIVKIVGFNGKWLQTDQNRWLHSDYTKVVNK